MPPRVVSGIPGTDITSYASRAGGDRRSEGITARAESQQGWRRRRTHIGLIKQTSNESQQKKRFDRGPSDTTWS